MGICRRAILVTTAIATLASAGQAAAQTPEEFYKGKTIDFVRFDFPLMAAAESPDDATEAAAALLRLGFEGLGLHRIIGRCDGRNRGSAMVMERNGMRREAHLIENEFVKGEWTDELIYANLRREWEKYAQRG